MAGKQIEGARSLEYRHIAAMRDPAAERARGAQ
jgi:hypothetical protein